MNLEHSSQPCRPSSLHTLKLDSRIFSHISFYFDREVGDGAVVRRTNPWIVLERISWKNRGLTRQKRVGHTSSEIKYR